ncbi:hypothetical protein D3C80_1915560 [compost metagenome]
MLADFNNVLDSDPLLQCRSPNIHRFTVIFACKRYEQRIIILDIAAVALQNKPVLHKYFDVQSIELFDVNSRRRVV